MYVPLILCSLLISTNAWSKRRDDRLHPDPEESMDAVNIIEHWGYPAEEHKVTTQDGYILRIQRIRHGRHNSTTGQQVMFLQHGLECSSTNWITNLPNESAAFIFADAGFDVWLGNFRGNTYGLGHVSLKTSDRKFWEFSWDEMSQYDLVAMIDYVLNATGQSQLYYAGHSEGTMTAFALFSDNVPFSAKVKKFFALAPVASVKHIEGALHYIAPLSGSIGWFLEMVGYNQFLPNNWFVDLLAKYVCGFVSTNPLCDDILFLIGGPNSHQMNDSRVPVYIAHTPAGTSTQNIMHFGQGVNNGKFEKYDFGKEGNIQHYGQATPPAYDLSKSTVRTYLFCGDNDWLGDLQDIRDTILPALHNYEYILCTDFNHLDFIWGMRAAPVVYDRILSIIRAEDGIL